ncbi:hypothetical protein [Massilia sp. CCM 8734]|uniref:hypothetical protein n=1 Tax=Massilia sp. CCM 8734 TaxID=2609283 RepID=UPI00141E0DF8|nr:hypothetical protein [Massilia sp. CCM 8734]NHZ94225.1 hypothetical protein [Massilia sp. CCM 8734]
MSDAGIPASPVRYRDNDNDVGPLILEMHRIDSPDKSPMQMISAGLLAHYRRQVAGRVRVIWNWSVRLIVCDKAMFELLKWIFLIFLMAIAAGIFS